MADIVVLYASFTSAATSGACSIRKPYSPLYLSKTDCCRICMLVIFFRSDATRCSRKSWIFWTLFARSFSSSGAMSAHADVIRVDSCFEKATFLLSSTTYAR